MGVVNALLNRYDISAESELFGKAFEHLVFLEIRSALSYFQAPLELAYWRSLSKIEVDFVIGGEIAVEAKGKRRVSQKDEKGLLALGEDINLKRKIIVSKEKFRRRTDTGIEIFPAEDFLAALWRREIF